MRYIAIILKSVSQAPFLYLTATLILALSIIACSQNRQDNVRNKPEKQKQAENQPTEAKNSNAQLVLNSEDGKDKGIPPATEYQFERERAFGGTDDVMMGEMGPFAVGPNDEVFLSDRDQSTIYVFQSDGSYIKSLGRQGRGPGEFMLIYGYTTMATQTNRLYVTDLAGMTFQFPFRMHSFSMEDFSFTKTIDLLAENKSEFYQLEGHYSKKIFPISNGTFLVSYHRSPNEYQELDSFIHYVIQDSTGNIINGPILRQKDRKQLKTIVKYEYDDFIMEGRIFTTFLFFCKSLLRVSDSDRIFAVNHSEEFRIDVYTIGGDPVRTIEHAFDNVPFNEHEVIDRYERTNYKKELGDGVVKKMIEEAEQLPSHWPAIQEMLIDSDNRLWVSTIVEDFEIYEWWVLEESGELITTFEWPRNEPIEVIKNGNMYTRQTDKETGLQQVVRYRIEME